MSTSASAKRQSILPKVQAGPKAPVNFSSSITIADTVILTGNHTINVSSESVIHPRARLESTRGRITIGRRCIVHERTHVGAPAAVTTPSLADSPKVAFGVLLEDYVTVEVAAIIESGETTIAEGCLIGISSRIGKGAKLGKVRQAQPISGFQCEKNPTLTLIFLALHHYGQDYNPAGRSHPGLHGGLFERHETSGQTRSQ
jgi:dynactin 6